jgi:hypothetical protein
MLTASNHLPVRKIQKSRLQPCRADDAKRAKRAKTQSSAKSTDSAKNTRYQCQALPNILSAPLHPPIGQPTNQSFIPSIDPNVEINLIFLSPSFSLSLSLSLHICLSVTFHRLSPSIALPLPPIFRLFRSTGPERTENAQLRPSF